MYHQCFPRNPALLNQMTAHPYVRSIDISQLKRWPTQCTIAKSMHPSVSEGIHFQICNCCQLSIYSNGRNITGQSSKTTQNWPPPRACHISIMCTSMTKQSAYLSHSGPAQEENKNCQSPSNNRHTRINTSAANLVVSS